MNVKELKELIKNLPADMEIIMSSDAEGNTYSPLSDITTDVVYIAETTWFGDIYDMSFSAEMHGMDDEEWEEFQNMPRSLLIYPTN